MSAQFSTLEVNPVHQSNQPAPNPEIARLQIANELLADFASFVSHDLCAPLRHLTGFTHILEKLPSVRADAQALAYINSIHALAERLDALMDGFLAPVNRHNHYAHINIAQASHSNGDGTGTTTESFHGSITELKTIHEQLNKSVSLVSNEFQDLVGQVLCFAGFLSMLSSVSSDAPAQALAHRALAESQKMHGLIESFVAFCRVETHELKATRVSMAEIVNSIRKEFESSADTLNWEVGSLHEVQGDPVMLRQVFVNLLGNAIKYSRELPGAHIDIGSEVHGEWLIFHVRDNGIGFDMDEAKRLFSKFGRLHSRTDFEGSGVGLLIVRQIIERHGGRVWAQSAPGQGATFFFTLPKNSQPS